MEQDQQDLYTARQVASICKVTLRRVTKWLKEDDDLQSIPVIAVTAFAMKDDEEKIMAAGCEAYLSKPIAIDDFLRTIRRFLEPV